MCECVSERESLSVRECVSVEWVCVSVCECV